MSIASYSLLFLLGLGGLTSCSQKEFESSAGPAVSQKEFESSVGPAIEGRPAPDFSFTDQSGKRYALSDFRGKVVLINFWATWCPPCLEEMPSMQALQQQMNKDQFAILALTEDDSWEPVNQFMNRSGFSLPIYADFDRRISTLYGTLKFPETYVLNKKGIVALKIIGATDWTAPGMLGFLARLVEEN